MALIQWTIRLSQRCQASLDFATEFAGALGSGIVEPPHALLGMLDEGTGTAFGAMQYSGVNTAALRGTLLGALTRDESRPRRSTLAAPSAELLQLLERALHLSATVFNHRYVGTEHLYAALLEADIPEVTAAFQSLGHEPARLGEDLLKCLRMR